MACGGPSSRDYRDDQVALMRVIAADVHTSEVVDPALGRMGQGRESQDIVAALEGQAKDAAGRTQRLAGEATVRTPEGKKLRRELLRAVRRRVRVIELLTAAARSGRDEDLLDAITATRELEESIAAIEERVAALGRAD